MCLEMGEMVFSHFQTRLGLEIGEKVSRNRRNDKKCPEMGENVFSHFQTLFLVSPVSRHFFSYFQTQKCLEMGKIFPPISRHVLSFLLFIDTFSLISRPKSVQKWEKTEIITFETDGQKAPIIYKSSSSSSGKHVKKCAIIWEFFPLRGGSPQSQFFL